MARGLRSVFDESTIDPLKNQNVESQPVFKSCPISGIFARIGETETSHTLCGDHFHQDKTIPRKNDHEYIYTALANSPY